MAIHILGKEEKVYTFKNIESNVLISNQKIFINNFKL